MCVYVCLFQVGLLRVIDLLLVTWYMYVHVDCNVLYYFFQARLLNMLNSFSTTK